MQNEKADTVRTDEGRPPLVSSWNRLYALVLVNLAVLIAVFYAFTKAFE